MKEFFGTKLGKVLAVVLVIAVIFVASGFVFSLGPQKVAAQVTTALDRVTAERDGLVQENGTMKAEIQTVTAQRDALQAQIDQLKVEITTAGTDKAALQSNIDALTAEKQTLQNQLDVIAAEKAEAEAAKLAAEAAAEEVFDIVAIRSAEMAKLVPESTLYPYNPRGEDWVGGYVFALEPGQFQVLFTSEGTISAGESNYVITPVQWRENGVVIQNATSQTLQFRLTGFAPSGFGQWPYRIGAVPDIDEILWSTVGQGDFCGSGDSTGCHDAMMHEITYDGTSFNAVTTYWDTLHAVKDNTEPLRTADWDTVDFASGWGVLMSNLSQPVGHVEVVSPDGILYLGVTRGRDMVVWLPAGAVITPPQGEPSAPLAKPTVVVLENRIGHTEVFKIASITGTIQFLEFRKDASPAAAGQFLVRYTAQSSAQMFGANAPTSADAIDLLVLTNK